MNMTMMSNYTEVASSELGRGGDRLCYYVRLLAVRVLGQHAQAPEHPEEVSPLGPLLAQLLLRTLIIAG